MKYALYKIPNAGLYSLRYIDNIKEYNSLSLDRKPKSPTLPVIITQVGDVMPFHPVFPNFVEIIECEEGKEPLTFAQKFPKNSPEFDYGWIDPEGNTYACGRGGHIMTARAICDTMGIKGENRERKLEELKWVKITMSYGRGGQPKKVYCTDGFITKKQADVLLDLNLHLEDPEVLEFINNSELYW